MTKNPDQAPNAALQTAADFIKFTVALGTGSIVLSIGLVTSDLVLPLSAKCLLVLSWLSLGISILFGAIAFSRIPVKMEEGDANLTDGWLIVPGIAHELLFLAGIALLGLTLAIALFYGEKAVSGEALTAGFRCF